VSQPDPRTLEQLRRWSVLLDSVFRVPGTNFRFGLDPLLGLIPGLGDLTTPAFSVALLVHAVRLRIPRIVQMRMLLNSALDLVLGAVPLVGDLVDAGYKANTRNLRLLEQYAQPMSTARATRGDWIFVCVVIGLLIAVAMIPFVVLAWLLARFGLF
jgi:hypothetical protein